MNIIRAVRGGFTFVKGILDGVESVQESIQGTWQLVSYPKRINEKRKNVKRKLKRISCIENDVNQILECQESRGRKKRKREVDGFLGSVHRVRSEWQEVEQRMGDWPYVLNPLLETEIDQINGRVDELLEQCSSFEDADDLLLDEQPKGGELLTSKLVMPDPDGGPLKRIWDGLMNEEVQRIGVHGVEGVGKTEIMMHIYNKLIENRVINDVHWITVSSKLNIFDLQDAIAKQVGVDLSYDKDQRRRASRLQSHWRKRKSALFLDGLSGSFEEADIGNPGEVFGCKLIIGAREKSVCARMKCTKYIEVHRLPDREAEILFREQLGSPLAPEAEANARLIAQKCCGLPRQVITMAVRMRGVDDPHEWRDVLHEL